MPIFKVRRMIVPGYHPDWCQWTKYFEASTGDTVSAVVMNRYGGPTGSEELSGYTIRYDITELEVEKL